MDRQTPQIKKMRLKKMVALNGFRMFSIGKCLTFIMILRDNLELEWNIDDKKTSRDKIIWLSVLSWLILY